MSHFHNLGDLIRRDRDLRKTAIIDLGGEQVPREFSYAQLDDMANGAARCSAVIGWRFSPPTAPNISRPISASCAPVSWRCQ
jgi:hypothetical protein